jgi:hypothetical protein
MSASKYDPMVTEEPIIEPIQKIRFNLMVTDSDFLDMLKVGDYVSLWTKPDYDKVHVYSSFSIGGSGRIGFIPDENHDLIQKHLLSKINYGISGPGLQNYNAVISGKGPNNVEILVELISNEDYKKIIGYHNYMQFKYDSERVAKFLETIDKPYTINKPIILKFYFEDEVNESFLGGLDLKMASKGQMAENPEFFNIFLFDKEGKKVSKATGSLDDISKAIRVIMNQTANSIRFVSMDKNLNWAELEIS